MNGIPHALSDNKAAIKDTLTNKLIRKYKKIKTINSNQKTITYNYKIQTFLKMNNSRQLSNHPRLTGRNTIIIQPTPVTFTKLKDRCI
jgi:hypothetical protein